MSLWLTKEYENVFSGETNKKAESNDPAFFLPILYIDLLFNFFSVMKNNVVRENISLTFIDCYLNEINIFVDKPIAKNCFRPIQDRLLSYS